MKQRETITIPLMRPDLRRSDATRFLAQMQENPFEDPELVARWEAAWEEIWQRPCVAFAAPAELFAGLKNIHGWRSGSRISASPLLHPIWLEAMQNSWMDAAHDGEIGEDGAEIWFDDEGFGIKLVQHNFGHPARIIPGTPVDMEDISAILKPLSTCGIGTVQLLLLDGNRMLQGGGACLALSIDNHLIAELKKERTRPPAAAVCALGLAQLENLDANMRRREQLAERYLQMYIDNSFSLPPKPRVGRRWEAFIIRLPTRQKRRGLQYFLNKAGIAAAPPVWHHLPFYNPERDAATPLGALLDTSLALPLYASLSDPEQKKIINRIHRWVERGGPEKST